MATLTTNTIPKGETSPNCVDSLLTDDGTTLTYAGLAGMVISALASTAVTPAAIGANTNNYAPGVGLFQRWSASAAYNVTGMVAGTNGETRFVWNIGTFPITFVNELTSTAANRFTCVGGADIVCGPSELMLCQYSTTTSRWLACKIRSDIGQGTLIVRQPGGVAGTDEVQISHNGTFGQIECKDGQLIFRVNSTNVFSILSAGPINALANIASNGFLASSTTNIGWSSGAVGTSIDTGLKRSVAGVAAMTDGSTGVSWLQNSAARSRVTTTDVTNVTTTLANITGLSFTTIASRKYTAGKILLFVENVTAADGIKLDLDGGTGTWASFLATYKVYDTSQAGPIASGSVTAIATDITVATVTGAAWVEIEFAGVANAAGTFIPRFAKNSDAAGAALTCRVNSNMTVEDCP
jgi:hypothetical protein